MFVQPPPFYLNTGGNPAADFKVYIGIPNADPTIEENKLVITDGVGGKPVSNPYFVNSDGLARNANGNKINPFVNANEYAIQYRTPVGTLVWSNPRYIGAESAAATAGTVVNASIESFEVAINSDLSAYDTVYIKAYSTAWAGTPGGPVGDFYAYRTGSSGPSSTGNPGSFFDSAGNEWRPFLSQRFYVEMFGGKSGIGNDCRQAFADMLNAASARGVPCYAEGGPYLISTASNTAPGYSNIAVYGVALPANVDLRLSSSTVIRNASAASTQTMFFAEDCETLSITGGTLDGNCSGATNQSRALYIAGCDDVHIGCKFKNDDSLWICASETKQTGTVTGDIDIANSSSYGVNISSGGCKVASFGSVILENCAESVRVTSADSDSFSIPLDKPLFDAREVVSISSGDCITTENASISVGRIVVSGSDRVIVVSMDSDDVDSISIGSVTGQAYELLSVTSAAGGIAARIMISDACVTGMTNGITIDAAAQLIGSATFIDCFIDGSGVAVTLGDDTQIGKVFFRGGSFGSFASGIVINQANGQYIRMRDVDTSGVTTRITGASKSKLDLLNAEYFGSVNVSDYSFNTLVPLDWTAAADGDNVIVTHNMGHENYAVTGIVRGPGGRMLTVTGKTATTFSVTTQVNGVASSYKSDFDFVVKSNW